MASFALSGKAMHPLFFLISCLPVAQKTNFHCFLFTQGSITRGNVLIAFFFFFFTLRTPWRSCLSHIALHGAVGLAVPLSWYHLFHYLPGREWAMGSWGGGLFQSHFSPRLQLHGDHGRLLLPHLPTAWMEVSTLSALRSPLISLNPARGVWIVLF